MSGVRDIPSQCDVLVVGLGPAGACAARAAAQAGLDVVAIEKRETIGAPVQCAEFVPLPMSKYTLAPGVFQQPIEGMTSMLPSGARTDTGFRGIMIDRAKFDQALAREAVTAGAHALLDTIFEGLDAERAAAVVRCAGARHSIKFKALVAADGPHSPVAEALGLPRLESVDSRQYTVRLLKPSTSTDIWLSPDYPGGYAWLFPKGEIANLGLGFDRRFASDLRGPLDALHAQLMAEGRVGSEILARTGGAIPVGGLREHLVAGNVLFVGDAGGLTHPITGAGIASAVISGQSAGEDIARYLLGERDALAEWEEDMRDQFEATLHRAVERRRWMMGYWGRPEAKGDALHRRGWIAFPEYFAAEDKVAATV